MNELLAFRQRFDACMAEVGHPPAGRMSLSKEGRLDIHHYRGSHDWALAAHQALRISAQSWPPAIEMLERLDCG